MLAWSSTVEEWKRAFRNEEVKRISAEACSQSLRYDMMSATANLERLENEVRQLRLQLKMSKAKTESTPKGEPLEGFSQREIKIMLSWCHPDKHDGKQSAQVITQKLLELRSK